jgi:ribosomal protein S18 acetylase RimI-like enzyme
MGMSVTISAATAQDAEQILKLQYLCYQSEAETYGDYSIEPLTQTLDALRAEITEGTALVARLGDEVVASVRGGVDAAGTARISKLIVHPRMQRHGLGGRLLTAIEAQFASEPAARRFQLFTGHRSEAGLRLYRSHGYVPVVTVQAGSALRTVTLEKDAGAAQETSAQAYAKSA